MHPIHPPPIAYPGVLGGSAGSTTLRVEAPRSPSSDQYIILGKILYGATITLPVRFLNGLTGRVLYHPDVTLLTAA